ncbi:MAG: helix-turn-helix transcriptional regulator [Stellaceae bacterium]
MYCVPGIFRNIVDLRLLRAAIKDQAKLEIVYEDAAGARTTRIVWPIALGFANEARVLMAWCETREAYRTFPVLGSKRDPRSGETTPLVQGKTAPPTPGAGGRWVERIDSHPNKPNR